MLSREIRYFMDQKSFSCLMMYGQKTIYIWLLSEKAKYQI